MTSILRIFVYIVQNQYLASEILEYLLKDIISKHDKTILVLKHKDFNLSFNMFSTILTLASPFLP